MGLLTWLLGESPERRRRREYDEATERWRANNARARAEGCPCGKPATRVQRHYGTYGAVPAEFWTCDEHKGMSGYRKWGEQFTAHYERQGSCSAQCSLLGGDRWCGGRSGQIGGPMTRYSCPVRPGDRVD